MIQTVNDVYRLSVLLQELKRAEDQHRSEITMDRLPLSESAVDRTRRLIKEHYWDALTRRLDADHLDQVVHDSKTSARYDTIYVPPSDKVAIDYFQSLERAAAMRHRSPPWKVVVLPPPEKITGDFVRNLDGAHGILSLKLEPDAAGKLRGVPYVVPGGRFNELYCWDSYFIVLGLLQDGRTDLARGMADNLLYEVEHYGKIPNANRTYYLTRSQPPFLTSIIRAVFEAKAADREWLASALQTCDGRVSQRLAGQGSSRHGRSIQAQPLLRQRRRAPVRKWSPATTTTRSLRGSRRLNPGMKRRRSLPSVSSASICIAENIRSLKVDGLTLDAFFKHDRAVRESGHDTTHRFDDRTSDFVSVDLNSLLYKYEIDFAELLENEFGGKLPRVEGKTGERELLAAAGQRPQASHYRISCGTTDADSSSIMILSITSDRPTSAPPAFSRSGQNCSTNTIPSIASAREGSRLLRARNWSNPPASPRARRNPSPPPGRKDPRQWDYPDGWPPHQMLAWQGFKNYGLDADAERLAYRWLYTIARNAHDYNGTIPEKFNVVTGSHDVFVEYGNVGTRFDYIAPEGFGWMNASFEVGMNFLSPDALARLRELKPPP